MSEIKPALSAEEWEEFTDPYVPPAGPEYTTERRIGALERAADEVFDYNAKPFGASCHALAALALYGQPFGFTWEDVDALNDLLDAVPDYTDGRNDDTVEAVTRTIAKMEALLPPREP